MTSSPIILHILGLGTRGHREVVQESRRGFLDRVGGGGRVFKEGIRNDGRGRFLDPKEISLIKLSTF